MVSAYSGVFGISLVAEGVAGDHLVLGDRHHIAHTILNRVLLLWRRPIILQSLFYSILAHRHLHVVEVVNQAAPDVRSPVNLHAHDGLRLAEVELLQ